MRDNGRRVNIDPTSTLCLILMLVLGFLFALHRGDTYILGLFLNDGIAPYSIPLVDTTSNASTPRSARVRRDVTLSWATALEKGNRLYCDLNSDALQPVSQWTDFGKLEQYGYMQQPVPADLPYALSVALFPVQKALGTLTLSLKPAENAVVDLLHDEVGRAPGHKPYNPTMTNFKNIFNPDQGAIIAVSNYGPAFKTRGKPVWADSAKNPLVPLRQWSDIVWLNWAFLAKGDQVSGLRYVIQSEVENENSVAIIMEALKLANNGVVTGPRESGKTCGHVFAECSDGYKSLLGTPNGGGVAWLLLQHREKLGRKYFSQISVFDDQVSDKERTVASAVMPVWVFRIKPWDQHPSQQQQQQQQQQRRRALRAWL